MHKKSEYSNWQKSFFEKGFYNPVCPASKKAAKKEAEFAIEKSGINRGQAVLDLCCGPGRHALIFAEKGFKTAGIDFSQSYIMQAKKEAEKKNLKIRFLKADARKISLKENFDLAVNFFTSFGYFTDHRDDIRMLKNIHRALKKGGKLLIDVINGDFLKNNAKNRDWHSAAKGVFFLENNYLSKDGKYLFSEWIKIEGRKTKKRRFFLRLYNKKRISGALIKAGFKIKRFYGGFDGSRLNKQSERLIVLAVKK